MISINGCDLSIRQVVDVARGNAKVELAKDQIHAVYNSRQMVKELLSKDKVVYGITTGFGKLADTRISSKQVSQLQQNLILSHCSGVGEPLPSEVVRAMMLLRANALIKGYSGTRLEVIQLLVDMLNRGVIPIVPSQGSVGASGDLVPLAHTALVMIGYGEAVYHGKVLSGEEALFQAGLQPVTLEAKEGLALINGTQCMTAIATLVLFDAWQLAKTADISAALTMEALEAIPDAFDELIHMLRPHPGQMACARNLREILSGSKLVFRDKKDRVQDAYSLRCVPQVHGASRDTFSFVWDVLSRELNSVTDNPLLFFNEQLVLSAGNFHGQPIALASDFLAIALSELANIAERRVERLVNPTLSGLPAFLTREGGINSGCMIAQYTAASLVSENKALSHPASVDSIPTSANQEDHVSMGTIAARKARSILENTQNVIAIELLCAAQAIEFRDKDMLAPPTKKVYEAIRERIAPLERDRKLASDISLLRDMVRDNTIVDAVERILGELA